MITNTDSYFDFASLAALKNKDAAGQSESSKAVLEKFEALFIDQMLQSMRKATVKSELFDSEGIKLYESLFENHRFQWAAFTYLFAMWVNYSLAYSALRVNRNEFSKML